jgi:predicted RNA-binding Zn-ribbon protein involved in translation (DUF1610 family)
MKTVPLHGKKAAGRVALVDDEDYDLVMQYRWYVWELPPQKDGWRESGPYAVTSKAVGAQKTRRMHILIMGAKGIDHRDHDGLNNQRSNLRVATGSQNGANTRPSLRELTSPYKGVSWAKQPRMWIAVISFEGRVRKLGSFASELEAAHAYDAAARELFGEFACPNFPEGPTQAMRDEWHAEAEARRAIIAAEASRRSAAVRADWWARREPTEHTCRFCGNTYLSRSAKPTFYCSRACADADGRERRREQREPRRPVSYVCTVCGGEYQLKTAKLTLYCGPACGNEARSRRRKLQRGQEARLF